MGVECEYEVLTADATPTTWFEPSVMPASGMLGGGEGTPAGVVLNPGTEGERRFTKVAELPLERGAVVLARSGGGGGYGPADERDAEAVRADVPSGVATMEQPVRHYGSRALP